MTAKKISGPILFLVSVLFVLSVFSVRAGADSISFDLSRGSVVIGCEGKDRSVITVSVGENEKYTLKSTTEIIFTSSQPTRNTILVKDNVSVNITLRDVHIENTYFLKSPLCLDYGETVVLNIEGESRLSASDYMAGIQIGPRASLTIRGKGTVEVYGGKHAAGIGGGWRTKTIGTDCGEIIIGGNVTVRAFGGEEGAGIGGGINGTPKKINISDLVCVYAQGGKNGAGIGGGSEDDGVISAYISGNAYVEALGGANAAGIGGGKSGGVKEILISGTAFVRAQGGDNASAIGAAPSKIAKLISIGEYATVRAKGGSNSSAIGGSYSGQTDKLEIKDLAYVYAVGESGGAGIGSGLKGICLEIVISGESVVEAYGGRNGAGIGTGQMGSVNTVTISDSAEVLSVGGMNSAGIGLGNEGTLSYIVISDLTNVIAVGGKNGAGIGSDDDNNHMPEITIKGNAIVTAQGGNYGAGIGYGGKFFEDTFIADGKVTISDNAFVNAAGGIYASGIGGGKHSGGISLTVSGNSIVTSKANCEINIEYKDLTQIEEPEEDPETGEGIGEGENTEGGTTDGGESAAPSDTPDDEEKEENTGSFPGISDIFPGLFPDNDDEEKEEEHIPVYGYVHSDYAFGKFLFEIDEADQEPEKEGSIVPPINHTFEYSDINYSSQELHDEDRLIEEPAKDVGAGAGCLFQGSCHIKGNAVVNDMIGDVSVKLVYGIGGFEDQITSIKKGEAFIFPTPNKEGYIFQGWYTAKENGEPISGSVVIERDVSFYATWKIIGINVSVIDPADGFVGEKYDQVVFTAAGGAKPYTFTLADGAFPKGITLDAQSGALSGTPTEEGRYSFTVTVIDANGSVNSTYAEMNVYKNNTFRFNIKTSEDEASGTNGRVRMRFEYVDNFTGEKGISEIIDLSQVLAKKYESPLSIGSLMQIDMVFSPNVGKPTKIYLESTDEDGWKCEYISVAFSGSGMMESFSEEFTFNAWYGTRDDGGMSFKDVALLVLIIIGVSSLLAVIVIIITRIDRFNRHLPASKKAGGNKKNNN